MTFKIELPIAVLNCIHSAVASKLMGLDEIVITIESGKVYCKHKNNESSGMIIFESTEFEDLKNKDINITMFVKDLKSMTTLIKKDKVALEIDDGLIVFKAGKITKNFPRPAHVEVPIKSPSFETSVQVEMREENVDAIVKSFADIKEGDIKITAESEILQFAAEGDVRSTNISFDSADVISYKNSEDVTSGFDKELLASVLHSRMSNATYFMEMGNGTPLKFIQSAPLIGKLIVFVAPKISD